MKTRNESKVAPTVAPLSKQTAAAPVARREDATDYRLIRPFPLNIPEAVPLGPSLSSAEASQRRKGFFLMRRTFLAVAACAAIGLGVLAEHTEKGHVKVTQLSRRDIIEKLDGKDASATVEEVAFAPGQEDSAHSHAGPVFGYVLEGEYEHAIDDEPVKIYKVGETFYEPSGCLHRVARNPSNTSRTRLLAVLLHERGTKKVTVHEKAK